MKIKTDVVIVGTGVAGMFSALKLPRDKKIVLITKEDMRSSDSFLAQGGICVLRDENDYDSYFEDTMKAGHYENRKESVIWLATGWMSRETEMILPIQGKAHIPGPGSFTMRISQEKKYPKNFWDRC